MKHFISICILLLALVATSCSNYSEGERVGVITKVSYSGKAYKSHELQLKSAPGVASEGMVGQYETFECSIDNDLKIVCVTPVDSIKLYAQLGIPVVVNYQQVAYLNLLQNRGATDYFVKSIKRAR